MSKISETQLGGIFVQQYDSLAISAGRPGPLKHWPWFTIYVAVPALASAALYFADLAPTSKSTGGLLAGIGVLGGLLFQVLAWVSARIAALADALGDRKATPYELALITRVDIARANIAYSSLVSVVFVIALGTISMLKSAPGWLAIPSTFLLLHLGLTLVLVLIRINRIGQDDRITALTGYARPKAE